MNGAWQTKTKEMNNMNIVEKTIIQIVVTVSFWGYASQLFFAFLDMDLCHTKARFLKTLIPFAWVPKAIDYIKNNWKQLK
jgi:hypothetical protein